MPALTASWFRRALILVAIVNTLLGIARKLLMNKAQGALFYGSNGESVIAPLLNNITVLYLNLRCNLN